MSTALRRRDPPPSLWMRIVRAFRPVERPMEADFEAGADFIESVTARSSYPPINSMSAIAAFPWIQACVRAKFEDVSKLPIKMMDGRGNPLESHPFLDLYEQPASRTNWLPFIRQLIVDLELTGHYDALIAGREGGVRGTMSLLRLHPEKTEPIPSKNGQIDAFQYDSGPVYKWEDVLHIADPSWESDIRSLIGEGKIRALSRGLESEQAAEKMAADAAARGRLEFIVSPSQQPGALLPKWDTGVIRKLREKWAQAWKQGAGVLFSGWGLDIQPISTTPRDVEFIENSERLRKQILAMFSVPPARLGLETANYATAQQQMKAYWEALEGRLALIADAFTSVARRIGNDPRASVYFDLSGVDALQESRSDRLLRVQQMVSLGLPLEVALMAEGFDELATEAAKLDAAEEEEPPAVEEDEPDAEDDTEVRTLTRSEVGRAFVWKQFIERTHNPVEARLQRAIRNFFRASAVRTAARARKVLADLQRSGPGMLMRAEISDQMIASIVDESQEARLLIESLEPEFRAAARAAFALTIRQAGLSVQWDESLSPHTQLARVLAANLTSYTTDVVRVIIQRGISAGDSIAAIAQSLMNSQAYGPERALRTARTEATRVLNAGKDQAYAQVDADPTIKVEIRKQWLSSRDGAVRDSHRGLDGQEVPAGALFTSPRGNTATGPGHFGVGAEDINCRCTTIPIIVEL